MIAKSSADKPGGLSEDVLAQLKKAEEEAASLRKELAAAKASKNVGCITAMQIFLCMRWSLCAWAMQSGGGDDAVIAAKPRRFDAVESREGATVFAGGE